MIETEVTGFSEVRRGSHLKPIPTMHEALIQFERRRRRRGSFKKRTGCGWKGSRGNGATIFVRFANANSQVTCLYKHLSLSPDYSPIQQVSLNLPTLRSSTKPDHQPMPPNPEINCKSNWVRYAFLLCPISIGHEPLNSSPAAQICLLSEWISHQIWWKHKLFAQLQHYS